MGLSVFDLVIVMEVVHDVLLGGVLPSAVLSDGRG